MEDASISHERLFQRKDEEISQVGGYFGALDLL